MYIDVDRALFAQVQKPIFCFEPYDHCVKQRALV